MAESLNAKHQVDEDKNGVRVARLIKLAIVFVVLLIVLVAVGVLTRGKSVEVQLFGAIFCIILIIVEMILGVILLIYGPRELNRFGKELGELVKEVELDVNQCSFDGAQKKLLTSEAYGGKTYEMEVLEQTVCQQKEPAEYYLAYVEIKKKNQKLNCMCQTKQSLKKKLRRFSILSVRICSLTFTHLTGKQPIN